MLGIVPAAGSASRLQPLGCSKELLPLFVDAGGSPAACGGARDAGTWLAVGECLLERMWMAGASRICMVISPDKTDLLRYFSRRKEQVGYVVQPTPLGLCDAVFRAAPWVLPEEPVLIGLPDTLWFPRDAYREAPGDSIHLITFPSSRPEDFDAVLPGPANTVRRIEVKSPGDRARRIWGAIRAPGHEFLALHRLWLEREGRDQFLGTLLNAWIDLGRLITHDCRGTRYFDIGTPRGYAEALLAAIGDNEVASVGERA